jgi:hypothetical protein
MSEFSLFTPVAGRIKFEIEGKGAVSVDMVGEPLFSGAIMANMMFGDNDADDTILINNDDDARKMFELLSFDEEQGIARVRKL